MLPMFLGCRGKAVTGSFRNGLAFQRHAQRLLSMNIFDTQGKRLQKNRTAHMKECGVYDYLKEEKGMQMVDRMYDVKRQFKTVVDFGCGRGYIGQHLTTQTVERLIQCDTAEDVLEQVKLSPEVPTETLHLPGEVFPFEPNSLDLVVSCLSLHWINDLPGIFSQVRRALKPDRCFLGCMFGGDTLFQLRVALQLAEAEREGGIGAHVSPFTDNRDLGNLLNQSGFVLLTIDIDEITVNFPSIFELMGDLKGMGENNCAWNRKPHLHRETIMAAAAIYQHMYGNDDGSIPATFQFLHFIGWSPDPSQPKPARRGTGEVSLKDIEDFEEILNKTPDDKK